MPQLDLMSFFSQFFWFSIGFSFFYIFLLQYIIPAIVLNTKIRRKKMELLASDINNKKEGVSDLLTTYDNIVVKAVIASKSIIGKVNEQGNSWVLNNTNKINTANFAQSNKNYLMSIGEKNFVLTVLDTCLKNNVKDSNWNKLWK